MIIEEYIIIGVGSRNLKHLIELGYDAKVGMNISVLSTHLCETSNIIIHAKCLKIHNYYCCQKCATDKIKKTNLEKYGVENVFQNEEIKDRIKLTNLINLGVENPQQSDEIKKKTKKTNLEKYGVQHTFQSSKVKEKIKKTILNRYGVDHPMYLEKIKEKIKKTNLERYGFEFASQNDDVRKKVEFTCLKRYGFKNPMQNDEIFEKQLKNCYHTQHFNKLKYKGSYELDFIKKYEHLNITNCKSFEYIYNDKKRKYFPDFYYEEKNLIIEIKSDYTYNKFLQKNLAKQKACIDQGYNFIFIINKNYDEFEKLINIY